MILVRRFLGKKIISLMEISALRHLRVSAHIFVALCTSDHKLSLTCYLWSTSLSICLPTWFTVAGITINYAPFCWALSSGKRIICSSLSTRINNRFSGVNLRTELLLQGSCESPANTATLTIHTCFEMSSLFMEDDSGAFEALPSYIEIKTIFPYHWFHLGCSVGCITILIVSICYFIVLKR